MLLVGSTFIFNRSSVSASGGNQDFPEVWAATLRGWRGGGGGGGGGATLAYDFAKFSQKLHEIDILDWGGGGGVQ